MKLRIITVTRGESPFWAQMARSVAASAPGAEHVVVAPVQSVSCLDPALGPRTYVPEVGPGLYRNLNAGLRMAGDWDAFTWINDDDTLMPDFAEAWRIFQSDSAVGMVYGRVRMIDSAGAQMGELPVARRPVDLHALLAQGIIPLAQPGTILRRELFEKLGGFDEGYRLAGDLDFFVRALASGAKAKFINAQVAEFRLAAGQLSKDEAVGDAEKMRALEPFHQDTNDSHAAARLRFRWDNRAVYFARIRRHGFVSMRRLYRHR